MKKLLETIATYCPQDEGEHAVQQAMLRQLRQCPGTILGRDDLAHMTASAFVINRDASRILLLYHNQMDCWAWPGGHADGCPDLLQVALRETWEETGVQAAPVCDGPISLDIFPVAPHEKRGRQVPRHLHLSLAYLLQADDTALLRQCPAENRAVAWQTPDFLTSAHFSPEDLNLYQKLLDRAQRYLADSDCKSGKNLLK